MRSSFSPGRIQLWAVLVTALAAAAVSLGVFMPALATGAEGITMFSGSSAGAIVSASNSGTGGTGLTATAANAGFAVQGSIGALNTGVGVRGVVYGPGSTALIGEAKNTNLASPSTGLKGYSKSGNGVIGQTFANALPATTSEAGVLGQDLATPSPSGTPKANAGIRGTSLTGIGVRGISQANLTQPSVSDRAGVVGTSNSNRGVVGFSIDGEGVEGESTSNVGVHAFSRNSFAIFADSRSDAVPALVVLGGSGAATPSTTGAVFTVGFETAQSCGLTLTTDIFSIDQKGDVRACGTITASTTPLVIRRTTLGQHLVSYSAQQSQPTIEDLGQGRLVNGQAYVAIEPRFAATIDARAHYLVFLTPYGDNRGLYVAQQAHAGFLVRESQGGRSTLDFDYRIVAKPFDTDAPRLPLASSLPHPRPVTLPLLRNQIRFNGGPPM